MPRALVFVSPHDRDYPFGHGGICRVGRVKGESLVVVIDLKRDLRAFEFEDPIIVLLVGIAGQTKIVKHRNGLDQASDRLSPEVCDPRGDDGSAAEKVLPKLVVKRANAIRVRLYGHGCLHICVSGGSAWDGVGERPACLQKPGP